MKRLRRALPLLLMAMALAVAVLAQQSPGGKPDSGAPADAPQQSQAQAAAQGAESGQNASGQQVGAAPAEASRQAASEGDENAEFKQSPSVRWLASLTGLSPRAAYWVAIVFNFAVIAGAIVFAVKSNLPALFRTRTESIQRGMEEARQSSQEAQRRLNDIEARLAKLDGEIAGMRSAAETEAAAEEQRIRSATEEEAHKIAEAAGQEIQAAARLARRDLTAYAADLAVSLAEKRIQVDAATDRALVLGFVEQLREPNGAGRKKGGR